MLMLCTLHEKEIQTDLRLSGLVSCEMVNATLTCESLMVEGYSIILCCLIGRSFWLYLNLFIQICFPNLRFQQLLMTRSWLPFFSSHEYYLLSV